MKNVSFYKPNSYNKGVAAQLQYGIKPDDDGLYVSMIKQHSWNAETKRGSFSENAKNPLKNKKIKLNATEASAIIRVIREKVTKWSSVHKNGEKTTPLMFSHYIKDNEKLGYGFSVSEKDGEQFLLSLTNDEGELLSLFLEDYVKSTFESPTPKGQF